MTTEENKRFEIFGLCFVKWTMKETVSKLTERIQNNQFTHVVTGNPIMVMAALENESYMKNLQSADIIVPDGSGIIWASKQFDDPIPERVAGFDLMHELLRVGETLGWKVFLLGTDAETIAKAELRLKDQFPRIQWVGHHHGFFKGDEDVHVLELLAEKQPDLLFVARSAALQEPWIAKHREKLSSKLVMGVGGSFDVISGKLKRAPKVWIMLRLEWFYRLIQEPWRLPRMVAIPKFMLAVKRARARK